MPIEMSLEIIGKILHRGHQWIHRVDAKSAERAIGHVARELLQEIQVDLVADTALIYLSSVPAMRF